MEEQAKLTVLCETTVVTGLTKLTELTERTKLDTIQRAAGTDEANRTHGG